MPKAALVLAFVLAALPAAAQRIVEGSAREENVAIPYIGDDGALAWSARFQQPSARFVRLRLTVGPVVPPTPFKVVITGFDGVVQTFTESTLPFAGEIRTPLIPGEWAKVSVEGRPRGLKLTVTHFVFQADPNRILSLIGGEDRKEFWQVAKGQPALAAAGKSVAKLSILTPGGPAACTGFLVSRDLLLTNEHCITGPADCANAVAVFGYQQEESGTVSFGTQFQCTALVDHDTDLDFALVRLAGQPGGQGGWGFLPLATAAPSLGDALRMIQHPGGHPKRIAFPPNCKVVAASAEGHTPGTTVDLAHDCDCEDGASGSPVLNDSLQVVALHRRGKTVVGPYSDRNRAVRMAQIEPRIRALLNAP